MSPVEDEQVPLVCSTEVGYIYSVGTDFCFRIPDLRRLDEEVDELMGSDVPTIRGTSEGISEMKESQGAAASVALPVKPVTAEVRRVTRIAAVFHWRKVEARNGRAERMNVSYDPQVLSFPLQ